MKFFQKAPIIEPVLTPLEIEKAAARKAGYDAGNSYPAKHRVPGMVPLHLCDDWDAGREQAQAERRAATAAHNASMRRYEARRDAQYTLAWIIGIPLAIVIGLGVRWADTQTPAMLLQKSTGIDPSSLPGPLPTLLQAAPAGCETGPLFWTVINGKAVQVRACE